MCANIMKICANIMCDCVEVRIFCNKTVINEDILPGEYIFRSLAYVKVPIQ